MALFLRPKMALALLLKINYQDEDRPEEEGGGRQAGAVSWGWCVQGERRSRCERRRWRGGKRENREDRGQRWREGGGGSRSKEEKEPRHEGREARASFGTGPSSSLLATPCTGNQNAGCREMREPASPRCSKSLTGNQRQFDFPSVFEKTSSEAIWRNFCIRGRQIW